MRMVYYEFVNHLFNHPVFSIRLFGSVLESFKRTIGKQ